MRGTYYKLQRELVDTARGCEMDGVYNRDWQDWLDDLETPHSSYWKYCNGLTDNDPTKIAQTGIKFGFRLFDVLPSSLSKTKRMEIAKRGCKAFLDTCTFANTSFALSLDRVKEYLLAFDYHRPEDLKNIVPLDGFFKDLVMRYLMPVFRNKDQEGCDLWFTTLYNSVCYAERLTRHDAKLNDAAWEQYQSIENDLANSEMKISEETVHQLRQVLKSWFPKPSKKFFYKHFKPVFGPGSIAGVAMGSPGEFIKQLYAEMPKICIDKLEEWGVVDKLFSPPREGQCPQEISVVPKNALKKRTIGKENSGMMLAQQGILQVLLKVTSYTSWSDMCHPDDQTISSSLALEASINGEYATFDYSAASDYITAELVSLVFPEWVSSLLLAARSSEAVYDNKGTIHLLKYAAMGSALCFFTEMSLFAACAQVAKIRSGVPESKGSIYGDDTIILSCCSDELIKLAKELGWKLNTRKSYWTATPWGSHFRESCGMEALNGRCITPLRVSRNAECLPYLYTNPRTLSRSIDEVNAAFDAGSVTLRKFLCFRLRDAAYFYESHGAMKIGENCLTHIPFYQSLDGEVQYGLKCWDVPHNTQLANGYTSHYYDFESRKPHVDLRDVAENGAPTYLGFAVKRDTSYEAKISSIIQRCPQYDVPGGYDIASDAFSDYSIKRFLFNRHWFVEQTETNHKWVEKLCMDVDADSRYPSLGSVTTTMQRAIHTTLRILRPENYAPPSTEILVIKRRYR